MRYEWKFGPAEVYSNKNFTDAVSHVTWYCVAYAPDGSTYKASGSVKLDPPDGSQFVGFGSITESTVRSWVYGKISKADVESSLASQYSSKLDNGVKTFNF